MLYDVSGVSNCNAHSEPPPIPPPTPLLLPLPLPTVLAPNVVKCVSPETRVAVVAEFTDEYAELRRVNAGKPPDFGLWSYSSLLAFVAVLLLLLPLLL